MFDSPTQIREFQGPVFLNLIRHSDGLEFDVLREPHPMISACSSDVCEGSYWYLGDVQSALWFIQAALSLTGERGESPSEQASLIKAMFAKAEFVVSA